MTQPSFEAMADDLRVIFGAGAPIDQVQLTALDPQLRVHSVTGGVFLAALGEQSAVLKIVRLGQDNDPDGLWLSGATPDHRNWWRREWDAYDSGLLDALPGRLRAPRRLLTRSVSPTEAWLWTEHVKGRSGAEWTAADYVTVAGDLGSLQGAFAAGTRPLPDAPWLSRDWLRGWVETVTKDLSWLDGAGWADPRLEGLKHLVGGAREIVPRLGELLNLLDDVPQTLLHLDCWPSNLFTTPAGTVAIDWSQVGIGAVAGDLDALTLDPIWNGLRSPHRSALRSIEADMLSAYQSSLADAGASAGAEVAGRAYAAAAAARYVPLLGRFSGLFAEHEVSAIAMARFDGDIDRMLASRELVIRHSISLGLRALG